MGVCETEMNFSYKHLGDRPILDTLAGVKYMVVKDGARRPTTTTILTTWSRAGLPSRYRPRCTRARTCCRSLTPMAASSRATNMNRLLLRKSRRRFCRASCSTVCRKRISRMPQAGPSLKSKDRGAPSLPSCEVNFEQQVVPCTIAATDGLEFEDGRILVRNANARLTLSFDGLDASETYVSFDNLNYKALSPLERMDMQKFESMPWYKQMWQRIKASGWSEPNSYFIYFKSDAGDQGRFIQNWNSSYHLYGGKSDWLVNLGYADQGQTYVTVTFSEPGLYTFDSLDVVCQPMGSFDERVDAPQGINR